jgi:HEAT repeat protein
MDLVSDTVIYGLLTRLFQAYRGDDGFEIENVVQQFITLGEPVVLTLIALLHDTDSNVRGAVATALGQLGDQQALEPLRTCLGDDERDVRFSASDALISLDGVSVPWLIAALKNENWRVRSSAAYILFLMPDERAVESLIVATTDERTSGLPFP